MDKKRTKRLLRSFLAAPVRLELTTTRLTAECSTDWAKEQYLFFSFKGLLCDWGLFNNSRVLSWSLCKHSRSKIWSIHSHSFVTLPIFSDNRPPFIRHRRRSGSVLRSNIFPLSRLCFRFVQQWGCSLLNICKNEEVIPRALRFLKSCAGTALFSQAVTRQVSSALMSLTSVFGMGTGGTSSPLAPAIQLSLWEFRTLKTKQRFNTIKPIRPF